MCESVDATQLTAGVTDKYTTHHNSKSATLKYMNKYKEHNTIEQQRDKKKYGYNDKEISELSVVQAKMKYLTIIIYVQ